MMAMLRGVHGGRRLSSKSPAPLFVVIPVIALSFCLTTAGLGQPRHVCAKACCLPMKMPGCENAQALGGTFQPHGRCCNSEKPACDVSQSCTTDLPVLGICGPVRVDNPVPADDTFTAIDKTVAPGARGWHVRRTWLFEIGPVAPLFLLKTSLVC